MCSINYNQIIIDSHLDSLVKSFSILVDQVHFITFPQDFILLSITLL